MAIDPWPTLTGMVGTVAGWFGLRYFRKFEAMEKRLEELEAALKQQAEAHDRFVDGSVKDLKRTVISLWKRAHPHVECPVSGD